MFKKLTVIAFSILSLSATETVPFCVNKISPSGAYNSKQFKTLWDAFRQEYSVTSSGTFTPYFFTEHVLEEASKSSHSELSKDRFFELFYDQEKRENTQQLTGNQDASKQANKYVNLQLAMDGARRYGARLATISVGTETSVPGVFACAVNVAAANDVDVRDTNNVSNSSGTSSSIVFCDPRNPRTGLATLYVEGHYLSRREDTFSSERRSATLREVGTILDNKGNQENFLASLKAGSTFRVFWFKETTCTNCGGLGRLSTLTVNQSGGTRPSTGKGAGVFGGGNNNSANSSLSLTPGVSTARDRCPACYGTGKRMRGYLSTLLWDDKGPSFDPAR